MNSKRLTRRDILKGATIGTVGVAMAACVPAQTMAPGDDMPGAETVTLRFMSRPHSQKAQEVFPDIIKDNFTENTDPQINVNVETAASGWADKLVTSMIAGDAVDIFQAWPDIFYVWVAKDLILDIQPYVDRDLTEEDLDDFIEAQWTRLRIRGIRVGMPKYIDVRCMAYNKDVFDEFGVDYPTNFGADWDWQELTNMAEALTHDRDGDGTTDVWGTRLIATSSAEFFGWLRSFGGDYVNPNDDTDCWLDEPSSQQAMNWLYENMWVKEPNPFIRPEDVSGTYDDFVSGRVAIPWFNVRPAQQAEQVGQQINWDYAHVPSGPVQRNALGDADAWSIWKGSSYPDEAWEFINFLAGPVFQELGTLRSEGSLPIRKSLLAKAVDVYREEFPSIADKHLEIIPEMTEMGYLENVIWFKDNDAAMELIGPAMERVFNLGGEDPSHLIEVCAEVEAYQASLE